ncbi:RecX family transcriptional regulator [Balneolaceae bacterium ANBcel3]|nr:RecX family transcriptional regulator [Balneolaceae bacterium ANBcel3]
MKQEDEIPAVLPGRCTAIETQSKNKERISLFIEGVFLAGLYRDTLIQSGIKKGDLVTADTYQKLLQNDQQTALLQYMYRWLALRNHCRGELLKKARAKGFSASVADDTLSVLEEKGLLNDALYAEQFAREKTKNSKWGPLKIKAALIKNGIKKPYIERALESVAGHYCVRSTLEGVVRSKRSSILRKSPGFERKKKITEVLLRKGFSGEDVFSYVDELLIKLEDEET